MIYAYIVGGAILLGPALQKGFSVFLFDQCPNTAAEAGPET